MGLSGFQWAGNGQLRQLTAASGAVTMMEQPRSGVQGATALDPAGAPEIWVISDGKAGSESVALGIAGAISGAVTLKRVAPTGLFKLMAPFGPVDPRDRFGQEGSEFAPPYPEIAIAVGRRAMPYLRALKKQTPSTFTVALFDSKGGLGVADVIWVPEHDRLRGANVITTPTSPHPFSQARISSLRLNSSADIADLPRPRVGVFLGGDSSSARFHPDDYDRLRGLLEHWAGSGASFLVTGSRRTQPRLLQAVDEATSAAPRVVFRGDGENPYATFLAQADRLIVTGDSISMCGEAAATGRPVFVFAPRRLATKFRRFHAALERQGVSRPLTAEAATAPDWTYTPIDPTPRIADEIMMRWRAVRS